MTSEYVAMAENGVIESTFSVKDNHDGTFDLTISKTYSQKEGEADNE